MIRIAFALALIAHAFAFPQAAMAVTVNFIAQTQNVLRFGHGGRLQNQCNAIDAISKEVDLIVMQEVMADGYPCLAGNNKKHVNGAIPTDFTYGTSGKKGRSSYVEYYGFLSRVGGSKSGGPAISLNVASNMDFSPQYSQTLIRPPYAFLYDVTDRTTGATCSVWIANFHAIFGKSIGDRRGEAMFMKNIFNALANTPHPVTKNWVPVLILGDWNLAANDRGFGWISSPNVAIIQPNIKTSLTASGNPSSEYDHGIQSNTAQISVAAAGTPSPLWTYPQQPWQNWRRTFSDHLGVRIQVTLQC